MNKLAQKVLLKNINKTYFIGAILGSVIGMVLCGLSWHFYQSLNSLLANKQGALGTEYIVINKKVSLFNSIGLSDNTFSSSEIEKLQGSELFDSVVPFKKNQFKAYAFIEKNSFLPDFYTYLFFESVPDQYLDIDLHRWQWNEKSSEVPIVIPRQYLMLYNFGFSAGQGLPQVSENMIRQVSFNLKLRSKKNRYKEKILRARIVGFTDRINSILVPESFLKWANSNYGDQDNKPSRVLLATNSSAIEDLPKYLEENNYQTNQEKIKGSKVISIAHTVLGSVGGISLFILVLAIFIFILAFQLLLTRNRTELQMLIQLGIDYQEIVKFYSKGFAGIVLFIGISSMGIISLLPLDFMTNFGEVSNPIKNTFWLIISLSIILWSINTILVQKQIQKLA
ncbi:hypothetical protein [Sediminitomix flava]|uniref:FtsX-like permease family protein n=1 Tax=Sediminitomix flava TaxID=379075 RepID=A0A315Z0C8_SEDFL|nr:hypothetical protein [Sediminitomix flava]PWJ36093.1 hypothetical protein BC781_109109 [Sediminitomix flava]